MYYTMDDLENIMQSERHEGHMLPIPTHKVSRTGKSIDTESRSLAAGAREREEWGGAPIESRVLWGDEHVQPEEPLGLPGQAAHGCDLRAGQRSLQHGASEPARPAARGSLT